MNDKICEDCTDNTLVIEKCFKCKYSFCIHNIDENNAYFLCGIHDEAFRSFCNDCIKLLLNSRNRLYFYSMDSIIKYMKDKDKDKEINRLLDIIDVLSQEILHLKYQPGGEGAKEAQKHFKKLAYFQEPRTKECIQECGEILPCVCDGEPECYCVCQKHPLPTLNVKALKELSGDNIIKVRELKN